MKNLIILIALLASIPNMAQYTSIAKEDLRWENYSQSEIRRVLLKTQAKDSEIYDLARRSRANRNASYALFALSGLSLIGAAAQGPKPPDATAPGNNSQFNGAELVPYAIGLGIVELGLGLWLNHQSRTKLKRALRLYHL